MAEQILNYKASEPSNATGGIAAIPIPASPANTVLADLGIFLAPPAPQPNRVRLIATVSLQTTAIGVDQILFRIFRDGNQIFNTQQSVDFVGFENFYTVSMQAIDFNVSSGFHVYTLTVERLTGTNTVVVGPITFSGLAIGPID